MSIYEFSCGRRDELWSKPNKNKLCLYKTAILHLQIRDFLSWNFFSFVFWAWDYAYKLQINQQLIIQNTVSCAFPLLLCTLLPPLGQHYKLWGFFSWALFLRLTVQFCATQSRGTFPPLQVWRVRERQGHQICSPYLPNLVAICHSQLVKGEVITHALS